MENSRLALNAYYNRDESLRFVRTILRPLTVNWLERGLIKRLYYRRSSARGHHFKLFITLGSGSSDAAREIEQELASAVQGHPSAVQFAAHNTSPFFLQYKNNSVYLSAWDHPEGIPENSAIKAPLEDVAACCAMGMLRHAGHEWFWPGVAIMLTDAMLNGFRLDAHRRNAALSSFLQKFVPANRLSGKVGKEELESAKLLLLNTSRDFESRQEDYAEWLMPAARERVAEWTTQLEDCCGRVGMACLTSLANQTSAAQAAFERTTDLALLLMFLGLLDSLLLEDTEALTTAYRLQQLYQRSAVGAAV